MLEELKYLRSDQEVLDGTIYIKDIRYSLPQFILELISYDSIDKYCRENNLAKEIVFKALTELNLIINSTEFKAIIVNNQKALTDFDKSPDTIPGYNELYEVVP